MLISDLQNLIFLLFFQMGSISFQSTMFLNRSFPTSSFPLITRAKMLLCKPHPIVNSSRPIFSEMVCISYDLNRSYDAAYFKKKSTLTETGLSLMALASRESGSSQEDHRALETVLRLYTAIKNRNLNELSDIIGEECVCISNFVSRFQPFHGKKEVMEFFSSLIGNLGNNFEFVVQPTLQDGMTVGVSWTLECRKSHVPLGKGFSFYMCHTYKGKVLIRNVEMFMEPLLHIEPLRLKMLVFVMNVMAQITSQTRSRAERKEVAYILCCLVFIAALFLWL